MPAADEADRLFAPAVARNAQPIREALAPLLEDRAGTALEIGAGTGQHVADWATAFPGLDWRPSDLTDDQFDSVAGWAAVAGRPVNLRPPIRLDAAGAWADLADVRAARPLSAVLAVNVIHIAPWAVAEGLVRGAGQALGAGGLLILYGPFYEGGDTAPGNRAFDASLRAGSPDCGVRELGDVAARAHAAGLASPEIARLPANNLLVAFRRPG